MKLETVINIATDPALAAKKADLRYISDEEAGYSRKRKGKSFTYFSLSGKPLKGERLIRRFESLVIPPMWEDVWICKDDNGHIQATGYDAKGRKQYIYHDKWREIRDRAKFDSLIPFAETLPTLRKQLEKDLRLKGMPREKVVATIIELLEKTLIRIGNQEYAKDNDSYGLTTLRRKHVDIDGKTLEFDFVGKSGKEHQISLEDKKLAKIVKDAYEIPGYELFKYFDEDGEKRVVYSSDVNDYLQDAMGEAFTAKDFRTWSATVLAAELLCEGNCPEEVEGRAKLISSSVKDVAKHLGNTPAVCRSSYIHPLILESYEAGTFQDAFDKQRKKIRHRSLKRMSESEAAVLEFLKAAQK